MAELLDYFAVLVPTGTTKTAPQVTPLSLPARVVTQIDVRIPRGPLGQVGFQFASGGMQVIPENIGAWLVGDDDRLSWPLTRQLDSGAWQLVAYNTGRYAHTLYVTFHTNALRPDDGAGGSIALPTLDGLVLG